MKAFFNLLLLQTILLMSNIALADASNHEPKKTTQVTEIRNDSNMQVKYVFMRAVKRDCLEGDTHIYSSIVAVDANIWENEKYRLLGEFQEQLYIKYPKNIFNLNVNAFEGQFNSLTEATNYKNQLVKKNKNVKSVVIE